MNYYREELYREGGTVLVLLMTVSRNFYVENSLISLMKVNRNNLFRNAWAGLEFFWAGSLDIHDESESESKIVELFYFTEYTRGSCDLSGPICLYAWIRFWGRSATEQTA